MALFRCGELGGVDIMNPDVTSQFSLNGGVANYTVNVTKKPKYLMRLAGRSTSVDYLWFFDFVKEELYYYGYDGSTYKEKAPLTYSNYVVSISSSSVTLVNDNSNGTANTVLVWY